MPQAIINHVDDMAYKDGVKSVKFKNRAGAIYNNDWIARVDYKHNQDQNPDALQNHHDDSEDTDYLLSEDPEAETEAEEDPEEEYIAEEQEIDEDELGALMEEDDPNPVIEEEDEEAQEEKKFQE